MTTKLQNENFKSATEAGGVSRLTDDTKIYVPTGSVNKSLYQALTDGDIGAPTLAIITNSTLNTYDMTSTSSGSVINHTASGGVMYRLPTAVAGKRFYFVHKGAAAASNSDGTWVTINSSNNKIDFASNNGANLAATLASANYTHGPSGTSGTLGTQIKTAMEAADSGSTYTITFDYLERIYTITKSANWFYFKFATGVNIANTARFVMGFPGEDGSGTPSFQIGMSILNDVKIQAASGDLIAWGNKVAETPGYLALKKRGVIISVEAADSTVWNVEQISALDHLRNTTLGEIRDLAIVGRNTWITKATGGTARTQLTGFSLNGYGYICNGSTTGGDGGIVSNVDQFNDTANVWIAKAGNSSHIRRGGGNFSFNGYGYVLQGYNGGYQSYTDRYNDTTNTWAARSNYNQSPYGRSQTSGVQLNGYGLTIAGYLGNFSNNGDRYNDNLDAWTSISSIAQPRQSMMSFTLVGSMYSYGGGFSGGYACDCQQYIEGIGWYTKSNAGVARQNGIVFAVNGCGYFGGGDVGSNTFSDFYQYNDSYNLWFTKNGALKGDQPASFVLNGYGYGCNGYNATVPNNEVFQYN